MLSKCKIIFELATSSSYVSSYFSYWAKKKTMAMNMTSATQRSINFVAFILNFFLWHSICHWIVPILCILFWGHLSTKLIYVVRESTCSKSINVVEHSSATRWYQHDKCWEKSRETKTILKFTNRFCQTENSVEKQPLFRPFNVHWTCECARVFASSSRSLFAYTCDQAPAITCAHIAHTVYKRFSLYRVTMMTSIRNVFSVYINLVTKPEKNRIIVISWSYFRRTSQNKRELLKVVIKS